MAEYSSWLWIVFTIAAAASQVARNAMQRGLTTRLGTTGAAHVRFLYGLPFALIFLAVMLAVVQVGPLQMDGGFLLWLIAGSMTQIFATAWMLSAMRDRSFVVTTAIIKTEPIQVALFAAVFLGEILGWIAIVAILIATTGVLVMSWPKSGSDTSHRIGARAVWVGLAAGGAFALSSVGYRGAILALGEAPFYARATITLACGLLLQSVVLSLWLRWREPGRLTEIFAAWRPSMLAGFMGALGSQMWFLAFSVQSVAMVRTLALVEVLFAQVISRRIFSQNASRAELLGIVLIIVGVVVLLNA
ncbi:MAG: EamA family transporter [Burkholderiaceae bacterium]